MTGNVRRIYPTAPQNLGDWTADAAFWSYWNMLQLDNARFLGGTYSTTTEHTEAVAAMGRRLPDSICYWQISRTWAIKAGGC